MIDKGYKLGGRLATFETKQGYQFDHGTPALETMAGFESAVAAGALVQAGPEGAWYGQPEMRSLCHHLAQGLSVTQACEIDLVLPPAISWPVASKTARKQTPLTRCLRNCTGATGRHIVVSL